MISDALDILLEWMKAKPEDWKYWQPARDCWRAVTVEDPELAIDVKGYADGEFGFILRVPEEAYESTFGFKELSRLIIFRAGSSQDRIWRAAYDRAKKAIAG